MAAGLMVEGKYGRQGLHISQMQPCLFDMTIGKTRESRVTFELYNGIVFTAEDDPRHTI